MNHREQTRNIREVILHRANRTGAVKVLRKIQNSYGEIFVSRTENYEELALSFLNLFDADIRANILHSPWYLHMVTHRISIHILYEELKAVQEILSSPDSHHLILATIERLAFGEKYIRYKLNGTKLPSEIRDSQIHQRGADEKLEIIFLTSYGNIKEIL